MQIVKGLCTSANVMVDEIDEATENQIIAICSQSTFKDAKIRIMADTHAGKGVPIGFTAVCTNDIVIPNLVGVDIGCSVSAIKLNLSVSNIDLQKLDNVIRKYIPCGNVVHSDFSHIGDINPYSAMEYVDGRIHKIAQEIGHGDKVDYYFRSLGTLGGGNHFISIEVDEENNPWILVHTGSRNFGYEICTYHQQKAVKQCEELNNKDYNTLLEHIEPKLRQQWIKDNPKEKINLDYAYLSGDDAKLYRHHAYDAEMYAVTNHELILSIILKNMLWEDAITTLTQICTTHNYIENFPDGSFIIRKGAVSAKKDEQLLIPLNMADGTLVCTGKGNEDWNCSAPHGAGRLMSRNAAKETLSLDDFQKSMSGIWSTCIKQSTIDEAPMAYKNADFIKSNIGDVVSIDHHLKPIYNFKAN